MGWKHFAGFDISKGEVTGKEKHCQGHVKTYWGD
jgi:hypothetical protein